MALPQDRAEAAELLGVAADASESLISSRYRTLAQIFHPDLNPNAPSADLRMQELNAARDLLLRGLRPTGSAEDPPQQERPGEQGALQTKEEAQRIRTVMHQMPYGIYIIGTTRDDEPNAMIADWVMQVSFEPRLVAVSIENDAYSLESVRRHKAFTINLLPEDGMEVAARFLQPRDGSKIRGRSPAVAAQTHNKLAGTVYRTTDRGCPILEEALTWLECEPEQFVPAGDHTLVVGRVVDGAVLRASEALTSTYTGWNYSG